MAEQRKRATLAEHGSRWLFLLACLCAAVAIVYAAIHIQLENTRLTGTWPTLFSADWFSETEQGAVALSTPSRLSAETEGETFCLKKLLPAAISGNTALAFQTKNETVRVWVAGRLIYTYGETPQRVYGHGVGAVWHIAQLPDDAAGQEVYIELTPIGGRTGLAPLEFLLGSRDSILSYLVVERLGLLVVCILLALLGVGALLLAVFGALRGDKRAMAVFWFSLYVLLASVWTVTDSGLLQFLVANKGVSYLLFGCSFYLLCSPFMLFMAAVEPEHRKLFFRLGAVNSLYAMVRITLYAAGVLDFEAGLWLLHILMGVIIFIVNLTLWLPILRRERVQRLDLCLAVTAFTCAAFVSLISFYVQDKLDMLRCGYSSGFYVGILLFVLIVAVSALRRVRLMRQQAFKAAFFEQRAYTDDLTGLLNAKGFDDKCAELLAQAGEGCCYGVLDFDVNFFSQYNANNGLAEGDVLLKRIAAVLLRLCQPGELCARQEADHFVCLLRGKSFAAIVQRVRAADLSVRGGLNDRMLMLSYGLTPVTKGAQTPAALRNQALVAKRTVKGNYENSIGIYDQALHESQLREIALVSHFETGLARGEYLIYLQPKLDVGSEQIRGAEALVRHREPDGSILSAGPIVEALESKGFVAKLDYYVLEQVCRFLRNCLDEGRPVCPISSNFSRVHLYEADFPQRVAAIVDRFRLPHTLVEVELTETVFLTAKDVLQDVVQRLHGAGFAVSIDDFGSGYSSLNMLKDVDVDVIKLDREFLAGFSENYRAGLVIEHTLCLAQQMSILTVAEGIETLPQLEFLRCYGCDLAQGFYFSRPLPEAEFLEKYLPLA